MNPVMHSQLLLRVGADGRVLTLLFVLFVYFLSGSVWHAGAAIFDSD